MIFCLTIYTLCLSQITQSFQSAVVLLLIPPLEQRSLLETWDHDQDTVYIDLSHNQFVPSINKKHEKSSVLHAYIFDIYVTQATNNVNDILIFREISNERYVHSLNPSQFPQQSCIYGRDLHHIGNPCICVSRYKAIHFGNRINTAMGNKEVSLEVHCL